MSRHENDLHHAISRLSGAEGTIHLAEMEETPSRQQARTTKEGDDLVEEDLVEEDLEKDSLDKTENPTVVEGDLEANKAFELTDQTLVSGTHPPSP